MRQARHQCHMLQSDRERSVQATQTHAFHCCLIRGLRNTSINGAACTVGIRRPVQAFAPAPEEVSVRKCFYWCHDRRRVRAGAFG